MTLSYHQLEGLLWEACFESLSGSPNTLRHLRFAYGFEDAVTDAAKALYDRTYTLRRASVSMVHHPVDREVFTPAVIDSVVSHMLYRMLFPMYEQLFDDDCYSCRKGKGTFYGIGRCAHHLRSVSENWTRPCYALLYDIAGYFISIGHERLCAFIAEDMERLRRRMVPAMLLERGVLSAKEYGAVCGRRWEDVRDIDFILWLSSLFVGRKATEGVYYLSPRREWNGYPSWKSMFCADEGKGLIIGDVSNQLFSNVNGLRLDRFVKRSLRCTHEGRYVDDGFVIDGCAGVLEDVRDTVDAFLREYLGQSLHLGKTVIVDAHEGVDYLGARILPFRMYCSARIRRGFIRSLKAMDRALGSAPSRETVFAACSRLNSMLGHLGHFNEYVLRSRVKEFGNIMRLFDVDGDYMRVSVKQGMSGRMCVAAA